MIDENEYNIGEVSLTSLSLLELAKVNNQEAWSKIKKLYTPLIYRWGHLAGLKGPDLADVSQNVLISLVEALSKYDKAKAPFRIWLRGITYHKINDIKRINNKHPNAEGGTDIQNLFSLVSFESEAEQDSSEEVKILYSRALEILNVNFVDWHVVIFKKLVCENCNPQDIAEEYQIRLSAVYNIKSRILRCLREEFAELITE